MSNELFPEEREKNKEQLVGCENLSSAIKSTRKLDEGNLRYTRKTRSSMRVMKLTEMCAICTVLLGRSLDSVAAGSCQGHMVLQRYSMSHKIE